MAKYGNILTVFNTNNGDKTQIINILTAKSCDFIQLADTFFIETNSKKNTGDVIRDLNTLGVEYIFFHNHISDGSLIKTGGIDDVTVQNINRILVK